LQTEKRWGCVAVDVVLTQAHTNASRCAASFTCVWNVFCACLLKEMCLDWLRAVCMCDTYNCTQQFAARGKRLSASCRSGFQCSCMHGASGFRFRICCSWVQLVCLGMACDSEVRADQLRKGSTVGGLICRRCAALLRAFCVAAACMESS
jgi:hypothetical protein